MFARFNKKVAATVLCVMLLAATTVFGAGMHGEYNGFSIVKMFVNGREITPDVPPIIMDGRTLLPGRALAEALGADVEWDESAFRVDINSREPVAQTTEGFHVSDTGVGIAVFSPTLRKSAHGMVAGSGNRFLQTMVVVKNFGKQDIWVSPETFSVMVGSTKHNFVTATTSDSFRLLSQVVRPGDYAAGIVIYEVPEDASYDLVPGHMLYNSTMLRVPIPAETI